MIAPVIWFIFVSQMDVAIQDSGGFEEAVSVMKSGMSPEEQKELSDFFQYAQSVSNIDCSLLELAATGEHIYLDFPDGDCASYYEYVSNVFEKAPVKPQQ
ncbi:MAG: hypothetical protein AAF996_14745 [Pseudomonadota bacterium]